MKVSVVIPIYNVEPYIRRCAESILVQDFDDYEVIFVNDATPDRSMAVLREVIDLTRAPIGRIRILEHEVNKGLGEARNTGLASAVGDWVVFVDSDDWVEKTFLSRLVRENVRSGDLVVGGMCYDARETNRSSRCVFRRSTNDLDSVSASVLSDCVNHSFACGKLFDLRIIKAHCLRFENITPQEDTVFVMSYLLVASRLIFTGACDYHYVQYNSTSLTKKIRTAEEYLRISDILLEYWTQMFARFAHVNRRELSACVKRFGLSQLLQAVRSLYVYNRRERSQRQLIMRRVRSRRECFWVFYQSSTVAIAGGLYLMLYMPFVLFDPLASGFGRIERMLKKGC